MNTHDPQKIIEDLRNNLAAHDRPIYFLFGAGTSSSINIAQKQKIGEKLEYIPLVPSIAVLTECCKGKIVNLGKKFSDAWNLLEKQCCESGKIINIESILSLIRTKIEAVGNGEKLLGLNIDDLKILEEKIRSSIAESVNPADDKIPEHIPHDYFASWVKQVTRSQPVEIFTTNYDLLIERSLEQENIPFYDGFVGSFRPFFYSNSLEDEEFMPTNKWAKLWKIHGSVNWKTIKNKGVDRVVRVESDTKGEMIFPTHKKYDESRKQPYTALLDRLSKVLNKDHSLLVTCGYSFGDQHINAVIFSALENRPKAHAISLQYEELIQGCDLVRWGEKRHNFTVLGPNAASIGGKFGEWKLLRPVDSKTYAFMDIAFDSYASTETDDDELKGNLTLGDFNSFCKFLKTMNRNKENLS